MDTRAEHLKIGLVLDSGLDKPDGVQQYVLAVGEWLRSRDHEVHYLVGETHRRDIPNLHSLGRSISIRFNGNDGSIPLYASKSKLKALMQAEQFDVLHVQVPHHPLLAQRLILAAGKRTAVVGTFHIAPYNGLVEVGNRLLGIWLRPSLKRFDEIISVSSAAAEFASETFNITTPVVPNVIDYARFHTAKPLQEYDDDIVTILFLGRLVPRKGCQLLLKAIDGLKRRTDLPKFRLVICGRGPQEAGLRKYVSNHGLDHIVKFAGFVSEEDKPRYYASADISVFPSSGGESFGIVLIEAMASGRSVVLAGDNPGYASVLGSRPGQLFDVTSVDALADKLAYYLHHRTHRHKDAAAGAGFAKGFDVNTVGGQLLGIYHQALHKRRRA